MAANVIEPGEQAPARPGWAKTWFQAVRFFSFTASVIPIVVGSALALVGGGWSWLLFVAMLVASVATHAGANLANDYFDHQKGIDTEESLGPSKVIQQGLLTPAQVRRGMVVAFAIATLFGLYIVSQTSWVILAIALASLGAAVLYTGGPKPLGYVALGELTVFIFMGPIMVCGAFYVLSGELTWEAVLVSIPIGLLVAAILHANNIRDIPMDRAAGKVTVATKLGRHGANIEYAVLVWGSYVVAALGIALNPHLWPTALVAITIPVALRLHRLVFSPVEGAPLSKAVRGTAGLHLRFGLFVTAGLVARFLIDRFG